MNLTLVEKRDEAPSVIAFIFQADIPVTWRAGQFIHYQLPHANPDDRHEDRFFTVSSAPHEGFIMLTTRFAEKSSSFKSALRVLEVGDSIEADEPEGDFVVDDPTLSYVFIAGGMGITPFRSILLDMDHQGLSINVTLLYANKTPDFVFKRELDALAARHPSFKIQYVVDPERIDEARIKSAVTDLSTPLFYVSGPEPMVQAYETMLPNIGVLDEHV